MRYQARVLFGEILTDIGLHFLACLHIAENERGIRKLHIAGVFALLLFTLLDVEIGLPELVEDVALPVSRVVQQNAVAFQFNFSMGFGCQQQTNAKAQQQNSFKNSHVITATLSPKKARANSGMNVKMIVRRDFAAVERVFKEGIPIPPFL